ncbi:hypothetical protein GUITHDRAFT_113291 [Guillardia theta CCMP2712]|uniref:Uncharacterized protein n=1 Tax=Guillardia theta (strain CCMP2712) TaxID=905079 RepID=L1IWM1_GUITC|nr:hypothetical protein GUITHDRAFT_113291 [Guillardia theta CCMP2712]EKX40502.1 hypothetical protein GUITHDRAFT_113291 [Guillardia theta CCMP2712]|eukprot:XP_005827482.1 hypothetical protein GUITHDRAFT_113291 [Guillardia theta CCMP2712]
MPKHSLTLSCQSIAVAEKAEDLEPNANEAAKDEEAAAKEHFEEDDVRPSALTIKSYNCTEIVPTLPARMAVHADSCSLWRKTGHVEDEFRRKLMDFGLNCLSLTPSDISFLTADGDPAFRTSEKYFDWGVQITVRDCNGHPMAVIKENLLHSFAHMPRAEYVVELPDGTEVARSKQGSFLSDTFMVFNTDPSAAADEGEGEEGAEASPKGPEPLAYARLSKGSKIRGQFCMGGAWRLNVNEYAGGFWSDPRSREVLMVLVTVKSVRDADRDNMGRVSEARCQESFWLSIVVVPLFLLAIVLAFFCLPDSACSIICGCFKRMKYHPV